jgi:MFS family permease
MVPMFLLTLPAGHLADNYNRKHIIVLTTLIVALTSVGLAALSAFEAPVPWVYLCLFIIGCSRTFLWAATASFLPQLVERKDFARAVNWNSGAFQLSSIVGPVSAGALIGLTHRLYPSLLHSAAPVYALNGIAALGCSLLMGAIHRKHAVKLREKMTLASLITGFRFVFKNRVVFGTITLDMFAVLLGGATALLPVYAKDLLHVGPRGLGFLQAAMPAGAVLCAFILAHSPPLKKAGRSMLWAVAAFGVFTIAFGFSQSFWLSCLALFTCGAVDNISVMVRHSLVQMTTPDEKRGRVSAVNNLFIGTSNELGEFESGLVAHWFGPVFAVVSGGIGTILVVIAVALIWPEIRKYGRLDTAAEVKA